MLNKFKRKFITLFLSASLIFSLAGCGSNQSDSQTFKDKYTNLKGRVITIGVWSEDNIPKENSSNIIDPNSKRINKIALARWKDAEKIYNCKIQWKVLNVANLPDMINGYKAGKSDTDIIYLTSGMGILDMIQNNLIKPLDGYINYNSGVYANEAQKASLWEGQHYGLVETPVDTSQNLLLYNKTLIQKLGFTDPAELQKSNKWTWDEFLNISKKATADIDNNTSIDRWGIVDMSYASMFTNFLSSNGGDYIKKTDNKFQSFLDKPESKEALQYVTDLYNKYKVVYKVDSSSNSSRKEAIELFNKGNAAFSYSGSVTNQNFEIGMVIWPKGPKASTYIPYNTPGRFYAIPSCVDDTKGVAKVLAYMMSVYDPSKKDHIDYNEEIKNQTSPEEIDLYKLITSNITYSWFTTEPQYSKSLNKIFNSMLIDNKSADDAINQEKASIESLVNVLNK